MISDPALAVAIAVFIVLVMVLVMFRRPVTTDAKLDILTSRIAANEEKLKQVDDDVRNVRQVVNELPTRKDIVDVVTESMVESRAQIIGIERTLDGQNHSLERIQDFLMQAASRKIVGLTNGNEGENT